MNLDEIRAMGIVEARKLKLEDVLKAVYEGETYQVWIAREQDEGGNWLRQEWEVRNRYDGNLVSRHRTQWTYHKPAKEGRVNKITAEEFYDDDSPKSLLISSQDKDGKEQPKVVKREVFPKAIEKPMER